MSQPFIGQIQPFAFNFAPRSWALCNGQLLAISQNTALFSLLGTTYGGDGRVTFALPNLQGRVPMHYGTSPGNSTYALGEEGGVQNVILDLTQMPSHRHSFSGTTAAADSKRPVAGSAYATTTTAASVSPGDNFYAPTANPVVTAINPNTLATAGGNQPHTNLQPCLTISWCICMFGIFPSRN